MSAADLWIPLLQASGIVLAAFFFGASWGAGREHREWMRLYERSNEVILGLLRDQARERKGKAQR